MILVLNLNASVDKRYELDDLIKGKVIRACSVENTPGGKGIHVANVASILGCDCMTTGFLGGENGAFIKDKLMERGIKQDFVMVEGMTRECLAFITKDKIQTEVLEPGPAILQMEQASFWNKYETLLEKADLVVGSGSLPRDVPLDFYRKLIHKANFLHKPFLLDTSGEAFRLGLEARPFMIKPNRDEVEALTGRKINSLEDAIREIKCFQERGIALVVISLGSEGSVVGWENTYYHITFPAVEVINPVGSGDAYVAGVAVGMEKGAGMKEALALASACGTANAMESESGFVRKEKVEELYNFVRIEEIN